MDILEDTPKKWLINRHESDEVDETLETMRYFEQQTKNNSTKKQDGG